jgi:peptidoglycan/LPS O-acetylase OafA/YrhL
LPGAFFAPRQNGAMKKPNLPALTGLRLVAALSVVISHGVGIVLFTDARWIPTLGFGLAYFGMSLFFVLSGFVIYPNYAPQFQRLPTGEAALRFAVARFARLYPLYAFFMLVSLATISWSRVPAMLPDLYWFIPMLQSWFLGDGQHPIMFTFEEVALTWSISTELFFYLAFPLLLLFRLPRIHRFLELPLLLGCASAVLIGLYFVMPHLPTPLAQQWLTYYSPYCRIFEFAAGMLTARLYLSLRDTPIGVQEARIAGVVAFGCGCFIAVSICTTRNWLLGSTSLYDFIRPNLWNAPANVFLLFYVARYDSALSRLLSTRLAVAGGDASYSIYLLHFAILTRFGQPIRELSASSVLEMMARLSIYLLITLSVAYVVYRGIEVPARQWIRTAFDRRQQAATLGARHAGE